MRSAVLVASLTTIGVLGAVPMSASATVTAYYAAPGGSGTDCTQAAPCTLASAITTSNTSGGSPQTVDLESGTFKNVAVELTEPITLQPDPADATTPILEGNGSDDVMTVQTQVGVTGLAITGGSDGLDVTPTGEATVQRSSFNDNDLDGVVDYGPNSFYSGVTADGNATDGIVISGNSIGSTTIIDSTASNNGQDGFDAIPTPNTNSTDVQITESTSYNNGASGIYAAPGTLVVADATSLIGNGQHALYTSGGGEIEAGGDIIAESTADGGTDCAGDNPSDPNLGDAGYNISDDTSCPISNAAGSVPNSSTLDASIGAYDNYGGPADTVPITLDSPAVAVVAAKPTNSPEICSGSVTDERGLSRPTSYPCAAGSFDPNSDPHPSTVTLAAKPGGAAVLGDTITLTTNVTGDVGPASGGTVDFTMAPSGSSLAAITTCNEDTVADIPVIDGIATCQIPANTVGNFHFGATFNGSLTYSSNIADQVGNYNVLHPTTTAVTVISATQVSATVSTDETASTAPAGTVHFLVGGLSAGSDPTLVQVGTSTSATATLTLATPLSGPATVLAQYAGDDSSFAPSSGSATTKAPTLGAKVSSTAKKTKYGWYDAPVKVTWTCTAGTGHLIGSCPAVSTLTASKANQSVAKTVRNTVGGSTTTTSAIVNIDRVKPTVKITGVKKGHTYPKGTKLHPKCVAKDSLSGIAGKCTLKITHHKHGKKVVYTAAATAKDKAGNGTGANPYHWDIKTSR